MPYHYCSKVSSCCKGSHFDILRGLTLQRWVKIQFPQYITVFFQRKTRSWYNHGELSAMTSYPTEDGLIHILWHFLLEKAWYARITPIPNVLHGAMETARIQCTMWKGQLRHHQLARVYCQGTKEVKQFFSLIFWISAGLYLDQWFWNSWILVLETTDYTRWINNWNAGTVELMGRTTQIAHHSAIWNHHSAGDK